MKKRGACVGVILIVVASFFFWLETVLPTPDPSNDYSFIGFPLGFIGIVVFIISMMRKDIPPTEETSGAHTVPDIIVRVLIVCPYCGAKNEQGILKCRACGAEM